MARVRLVIDHPTADLWDGTARRVMISTVGQLADLEWSYKPAGGGLWRGKATLQLEEGSYAWERFVRAGESGLAWVYWDRDENAADGLDETTDLLWFGVAEDAAADPEGDLVSLRLRGAGEFLKRSLYTGVHEGESIHTIADAILQSVIDDGNSPVTSFDTDNDGALLRKVSIDFDRTPVDRALKQLVALAGGESRVCWGVRPASSADSFGEAYVKLWSGHLWEKSSTTDRRVFTWSDAELTGADFEAKTSDVFNDIVVIGDEIEGDENATQKTYFEAQVESPDSIAKYGRRRKVVRESSLTTDGQCAIVAAGICKAESVRELELKPGGLIDLHKEVTVVSKAQGLIQTTLRDGGKLLLVRKDDRPLSKWGNSQVAYRATRDAATAAYLRVELASAPTGADAPLQDPASLVSGDYRFYAVQPVWGSVTYSTTGLSVMEIDQRLAMVMVETSPSSGVWEGRIYALQGASGAGVWTLVASGGSTVTTAQLQAEHALGLEVKYGGSGVTTVTTVFATAAAATQLATANVNHSTFDTISTSDRWFLNAAAFGAGGNPLVAGDCGTSDYIRGFVLRDTSSAASPQVWLQNLYTNGGQGRVPFKRYGDLVLLTNFGHEDSNGAGWVRYAFGQTTRRAGYDAQPQGDAADSRLAAASVFNSRNYDVLLGRSRAAQAYGSHLELLPLDAKVRFNGPEAPLSVDVKSISGTRLATEVMESLAETIAAAEENARKGVA